MNLLYSGEGGRPVCHFTCSRHRENAFLYSVLLACSVVFCIRFVEIYHFNFTNTVQNAGFT